LGGIGLAILASGVTQFSAPVLSAGIALAAGATVSLAVYVLPDRAWIAPPKTRLWIAATCGTAVLGVFLMWWVRDPAGASHDLKTRLIGVPLGWAFVSVIALATGLVTQMQNREREWRYSPDPGHARFGEVGWFRIFGLGLAVGIVALELGGELLRASSLDRTAQGLPFSVGILLAVALSAVMSAAAARALAHPPYDSRRNVSLRRVVTFLILAAVLGWCLGPIVLAHQYHEVGWGLAFGFVTAVAYYHSFMFHSAYEHEARASSRVRAVATVCAGAAGASIFWLLSAGVWADRGPADARATANVVVISLVATALVMGLSGGALCRSRSGDYESIYSPQQNLTNDILGYTGVPIVAGVIPAVAASRLHSADPSDLTVVIIMIATLSALGLALRALRLTAGTIDRYLDDERRGLSHRLPPAAVRRRMAIVGAHFRLFRSVVGLYLGLGTIWLLIIAFSA